jgi:hypothetical protein
MIVSDVPVLDLIHNNLVDVRFYENEILPENELIHNNLVDVRFYENEILPENELIDLSSSVSKLIDEILFFDLRWSPIEKKIIPLQQISKIINDDKKIIIKLSFHDINGTIIYEVVYYDAKLNIKTDLSYFAYDDQSCKLSLEVGIMYDCKKINV